MLTEWPSHINHEMAFFCVDRTMSIKKRDCSILEAVSRKILTKAEAPLYVYDYQIITILKLRVTFASGSSKPSEGSIKNVTLFVKKLYS